MHKDNEGVYAVLRYDSFQGKDAHPEIAVTVKGVVRTQAVAEAEVARLNAINSEKHVRYWWQYTRLFPEGRLASSTADS
jgi:hypothetical protein